MPFLLHALTDKSISFRNEVTIQITPALDILSTDAMRLPFFRGTSCRLFRFFVVCENEKGKFTFLSDF